MSGGEYPLLKNPAMIAASDQLSLLGNMVFKGDQSSELTFLSAGSINTSELSSVSHPGTLGFGSFDSLTMENVSLTATKLHLRSLDSVILRNSSLVTNSNGADFIHVLAAKQIDAEQLSIRTREIIMSAVTINLTSVSFPDNSDVYLNSAHGPINGKYPNFGTSQFGRVNFIRDVKYGAYLLNSTTSFDAHGNRISIGSL